MDAQLEKRLIELEVEHTRELVAKRRPDLAGLVQGKSEPKEGKPLVHYLYGYVNAFDIDYGSDLDNLKSFLDRADGADVEIRINSYGGSASAGTAMFNLLREYEGKVTTRIDGIAASAATLPFLAGSDRIMGKATELMIHNPSLLAYGDEKQMANIAEYLGKITSTFASFYAELSNLTEAEARAAMEKETFYTVAEAVDAGLATAAADDSDEDDEGGNDDDADMSLDARMAAQAKTLREIELSRIRS